MSGEIVAYRRGGGALPIPEHFFIRRSGRDAALVPPEANDAVCEEVENWLRETLRQKVPTAIVQNASTLRPGRLDLLLEQCDPDAPEPDELKAWRDMPDAGREVLAPPSPEDVRAAAVNRLGLGEAQRWMATRHPQLENQRPEAWLVENPQRVYALLVRETKRANE